MVLILTQTITRIAKKNSNVVGVKLTCASLGKITRLAASFKPEEFAVFGRQSDFLVGGLSVGSAGCIAAFANVFPKSLAMIYRLHKEGRTEEALKIHRVAALAESPCKSGAAATKYAAPIHSARATGIGGAEEKLWPRKPYWPPSEDTKKGVRLIISEFAIIEQSL
jgi:4-hydroxy-2-oxoglutarate aldolase